MIEETTTSSLDRLINEFLARDPEAKAQADAFQVEAEAAETPEKQAKRLTTFAKNGRISDFTREFNAALSQPYSNKLLSVAHLWAETYCVNTDICHPDVAKFVLANASFIAGLPRKTRLLFVETLMETSDYSITSHWLVITSRSYDLTPHQIAALVTHKAVDPDSCRAMLTSTTFLRRLTRSVRMSFLERVFEAGILTDSWVRQGRKIGLADAEIARLVTERVAKIQSNLSSLRAPSANDIRFLRTLLLPARTPEDSYRRVLSDYQLALVVDVIRRCLSHRTPEEQAALVALCTGTLNRRYKRLW